jgi:2-amino-4-hydroxy-6-hydroxymethyldihydropteridine diphosphokinase
MARIYIALGSNLGDRQALLQSAADMLAPDVRVLHSSPIYETAPWGYADQGAFLNQVVEAETELTPRQLLVLLKAIEMRLGRKPRMRNGPREIDLDILLYGDEIVNEPNLIVPHPGLHERAFILTPLANLAPSLTLPGRGQTVAELLSRLDASGVKRYTG